MLQLRPSCEHCNKPLPPHSEEAMICSFECTFCIQCVQTVLEDICPNCGGNFVPRPIRPSMNWKDDNYLGNFPASKKAIYKIVNLEQHKHLVKQVKEIPPTNR